MGLYLYFLINGNSIMNLNKKYLVIWIHWSTSQDVTVSIQHEKKSFGFAWIRSWIYIEPFCKKTRLAETSFKTAVRTSFESGLVKHSSKIYCPKKILSSNFIGILSWIGLYIRNKSGLRPVSRTSQELVMKWGLWNTYF